VTNVTQRFVREESKAILAGINDKTALAEVAEFERAPPEFGPRVQATLGHLGTSPVELVAAVESIAQLVRETIDLTAGLYQPRYTLPK
jgi:hypothetical protein